LVFGQRGDDALRELHFMFENVEMSTSSSTAPSSDSKTEDGNDVLLVDKLGNASKWAAGGFTALSAVLLFFGIKDGVLDQALRLNPLAALCVFMLLGIGVVGSLFTGAINPNHRIPMWILITAVGAMMLVSAALLPNVEVAAQTEKLAAVKPGDALRRAIPWILVFIVGVLAALAIPTLFTIAADQNAKRKRQLYVAGGLAIIVLLGVIAYTVVETNFQAILSLIVAVLFLIGIAWSIAGGKLMSSAAALLILAVTATSIGLYGASKLSVESKMLAVEPQVSAVLEESKEGAVLKVSALAARMRGDSLKVTVKGQVRTDQMMSASGDDGWEEIWHEVLQPSGLDEINATVPVPLQLTRWEFLRVSHCKVDKQTGAEHCAADSQVFQVRNPRGGAEVTGHIEARSAKSLDVTLTGKDVAPLNRIEAEVCRVRKGAHATQLAYATLTPDDQGALSWKPSVPAGKEGDALVLQYKECRRGMSCTKVRMTQLARYTLP
jgi:MFS family permease